MLFINGSMTENTTKGDLDHAAILNRSEDKGCFSVWEKITKNHQTLVIQKILQ